MARKERAYILEIGMVQTHVHLLARVHPTISVSSLVKRLKGASSAVAAQEGVGKPGRLYWAKGYSVQSVSVRAVDVVRAYLRRQPLHHPEEAIVGWDGDVPEYDSINVAVKGSVVQLRCRALYAKREHDRPATNTPSRRGAPYQ